MYRIFIVSCYTNICYTKQIRETLIIHSCLIDQFHTLLSYVKFIYDMACLFIYHSKWMYIFFATVQCKYKSDMSKLFLVLSNLNNLINCNSYIALYLIIRNKLLLNIELEFGVQIKKKQHWLYFHTQPLIYLYLQFKWSY